MTDSGIDSSVAILRALLTEDFETYSRLNSELDRSANKAFAAVLGAGAWATPIHLGGKLGPADGTTLGKAHPYGICARL